MYGQQLSSCIYRHFSLVLLSVLTRILQTSVVDFLYWLTQMIIYNYHFILSKNIDKLVTESSTASSSFF
jgi:hypothetical protein